METKLWLIVSSVEVYFHSNNNSSAIDGYSQGTLILVLSEAVSHVRLVQKR